MSTEGLSSNVVAASAIRRAVTRARSVRNLSVVISFLSGIARYERARARAEGWKLNAFRQFSEGSIVEALVRYASEGHLQAQA
jgi:hypothetical protein